MPTYDSNQGGKTFYSGRCNRCRQWSNTCWRGFCQDCRAQYGEIAAARRDEGSMPVDGLAAALQRNHWRDVIPAAPPDDPDGAPDKP